MAGNQAWRRSASASRAGATRRGAACSIRATLPQRLELEYRVAHFPTHRDQRLVLLAAAAGVATPLVRRDAGGFVFARQGLALHHAHEEAARRRGAAGQLLRLRRASSCATKLGPDPVAVSAELPLRAASAWRDSSSCCRATREAALRARAQARRAPEGPRAARDRRASGRCATRSRSATRASSIRRSSRCCASTTSRWSSPTRPGAGR